MMKTIPLTRGKVALVDDADYEHLNKRRWYALRCGNSWYAVRSVKRDGKVRSFKMHREILGLGPVHPHVDHWNRDGLDNQRSNLRVCTKGQNAINSPPNTKNKAGLKGVSMRRYGSFQASIKRDGKRYFLGTYATAKGAAYAYDQKARELWGEFAWTNGDHGYETAQSTRLSRSNRYQRPAAAS